MDNVPDLEASDNVGSNDTERVTFNLHVIHDDATPVRRIVHVNDDNSDPDVMNAFDANETNEFDWSDL